MTELHRSMWRDTTSYSRSDEKREPTTYTAENGRLTITITCRHFHCPGEWVMHCHRLGIDTFILERCKGLEEAKTRAIDIVKDFLKMLLEDANGFTL